MKKSKKAIKKSRSLIVNIILLITIATLTLFIIWISTHAHVSQSTQSSPIMARMETELNLLNLPDQDRRLYKDDTGCSVAFDGQTYCDRTVSYTYSNSLFNSKDSITESIHANGWIENNGTLGDNSKLNYFKKSGDHSLCLVVFIDVSILDYVDNSVTIHSDEMNICKGNIGLHDDS
ncbi:MAG: hypothetical protein V4611_04505 [Patescibacteria group bacterium]